MLERLARRAVPGCLRFSGARRGSLVISLALCCLVLASAQAVAGGDFDAGRFLPVAGPRLAGDELVWAQSTPAPGFLVLARPLTGGPQRTVYRLDRFGAQIRLAASPEQVLVQQRLSTGSGGTGSEQGIFPSTLRFPRGGGSERFTISCGTCYYRDMDVDRELDLRGPRSRREDDPRLRSARLASGRGRGRLWVCAESRRALRGVGA